MTYGAVQARSLKKEGFWDSIKGTNTCARGPDPGAGEALSGGDPGRALLLLEGRDRPPPEGDDAVSAVFAHDEVDVLDGGFALHRDADEDMARPQLGSHLLQLVQVVAQAENEAGNGAGKALAIDEGVELWRALGRHDVDLILGHTCLNQRGNQSVDRGWFKGANDFALGRIVGSSVRRGRWLLVRRTIHASLLPMAR
jgi:hypothetical protein